MITYKLYDERLDKLAFAAGFFDGWPNPPSDDVHRKLLKQSYYALVAIDETRNQIVGFVNAISDGVLSVYVPLLEVVASYQNQGIGQALMERLLHDLQDFYMIDLSCDESMQAFYKRFEMHPARAMIKRNFKTQSGFTKRVALMHHQDKD